MKKLLLASIVTFASLNVLADPEAMVVHPLDADKDGLISMDEAKVDITLSAIFADLDLDHDGFLTHTELDVKTQY